MIRAHDIRMYPTEEQLIQLNKTVGCCRVAWNKSLAYWNEQYYRHCEDSSIPKPTSFSVAKWYKENRESWATETATVCQRQSILHLGTAFQNYYKRPDHFKHPKFHKKGVNDSFEIQNDKAKLKGKQVMLPKIGLVKLAENLRYTGKICYYTVKKVGYTWHLVVTVEVIEDVRPVCNNSTSVVGVDVGLLNAATCSDGTVLRLPVEKLKKLDLKMRRQQRALARSKKNSMNRLKKLAAKQKTQSKINNIRKDAVHKFTTQVTKNHGIVVVEDLNIKEMKDKAEFKAVRRAYNNSVMSMVLWCLSYKAQDLRKADRYFPSSKLCSNCGHKKENLELSDRTYTCEACGLSINRDLNASINLMKSGMVNPVVSVESEGTL